MSSRSLVYFRLPKDTLSALTRCGYETVEDLETVSAEDLAKELKITGSEAETIIAIVHSYGDRIPSTLPLTQSTASLTRSSQRFSTKIPGIDKLLRGGLPRGHICELSGIPGSPKETAALGIMASFIEANEHVLFIDCQNMVQPARLKNIFSHRPESLQYVQYKKIHTLVDLMIFMRKLPSVLEAHPKATLLVIAPVSLPFQYPNLSLASRNALLEVVKQALTKACTSRNLTIVTTSQLAMKLLKADGTPGTFDTGVKGIMLPQLGHTYLPSGKTYRIILSRNSPTSGFAVLLSTPSSPQGTCAPEVEAYEGV